MIRLVSLMFTLVLFTANADELDDLFIALEAAPSYEAASIIEESIWLRWLTGPTDDDTALMIRTTLAMQQGELTFALVLLDQLTEQAPNFAEAWNKRATVNYLLGDYETAFFDIDKTLELEPRHFGAWSGLGLMLEHMGRYQAAIQAHQKVLELYPTSEFSRDKIVELREAQIEGSI